ncbi:MAG: hypothetical protein JO092_10590 [Candidatus Eremiobacteraeota bacterium]|nr:hypothetical protein [Candidatus Eremiobacteraeota bacterium]
MEIVLVDHHCARFFDPAEDGAVKELAHVEPYDPHGIRRHLEHRESHYKGQRVPEEDEYYEQIAQRLKEASSILLIGDAKGKSSAMLFLVEYLREKHRDTAERVIAMVHADLSKITIREIEEIGRQYA